jgi:trehalose synthase
MIRLADYEPVVGVAPIRKIRNLASTLSGLSLTTVNSTRVGGGVAEILQRLVPLLSEIGIETRWEVIEGNEQFFRLTKKLHNALQGNLLGFDDDDRKVYLQVQRENAKKLDLSGDVVLIHDPQPAGLISEVDTNQPWVWRCHIDLSQPSPQAWEFIRGYVEKYTASIFTLSRFARQLPHAQYLIAPTIDPFSEKNRDLDEGEVERVYSDLGIPLDKPVLLQVSRFDRFKDPVGVIKAFQLARKHCACRLVLAGGSATDDPEGAEVLREVRRQAESVEDVHILELEAEADHIVNALQRGATIVIQKSLKEGFGLTVTEALWKGKPVIGGAAGGILTQVYNGFDGYVVHSVEGCAYWIRYLLTQPELCRALGQRGRELVRRSYLITRHLRDYLVLLHVVTGKIREF